MKDKSIKVLIIKIICAAIMALGMVCILGMDKLARIDSQVEIMICTTEEAHVEILDVMYNEVSIGTTGVRHSEHWERLADGRIVTSSKDGKAYATLVGTEPYQIVFGANSKSGSVQLYVEGQLTGSVDLSTVDADTYVWECELEPTYNPQIAFAYWFINFCFLFLCLYIINNDFKNQVKNILHWLILTVIIGFSTIGWNYSGDMFGGIYKTEIFFILSMSIWVVLQWIQKIKKSEVYKKICSKRIWIDVVASFVIPIVSMILVEWILQYEGIFRSGIHFGANVIWYYLLYVVLYAICGKVRVAVRLQMILCFFAGMADYFLLLFRDRPVIPSDLYVIGLAAQVSGGYVFMLTDRVYCGALILIGIYLVSVLFPEKTSKKTWKTKLVELGTCCICLAIAVGLYNKVDYKTLLNVEVSWWGAKEVYRTNGIVASFLTYAQSMRMKAPDGYSVEYVENLLREAAQSKQYEIENNNPNVIVIMNEAWSDLGTLSEREFNEDYAPFFHSMSNGMAENTVTGNLYVSIYGGNTSNTEYEFLTGNTMAFFPYGMIPYQSYILGETESLTTLLESDGYVSAAIHPYYSNGYCRDRVYPLLGFDKSYFLDDFEDPEMVKWCISDKSSYEKINEIYENKPLDQSLFVFNVTMQNHGEYGAWARDGRFETTIELQDVDTTGMDVYDIEEYFSQLKISDDALADLIAYYSKVEEETVIVMFGDHQPRLSDTSYNLLVDIDENDLQSRQKRYQVPFLIWANYDIEERSDIDISSNYLSSYVMEVLGEETDAYGDFLQDMRAVVPVINAFGYQDANGTWYRFGEGPVECEEWIHKYRCVQYYMVFE